MATKIAAIILAALGILSLAVNLGGLDNINDVRTLEQAIHDR